MKQQAIVDAQHIDNIMQRWACGQNSCPNKSGHCYIVDGVHLKMLAQQMKTWSKAINEAPDEVDFETAPISLARTFMPTKPSTKNPLRESGKAEKPPEIPVLVPASTIQLPPSLPPYHYPGYSPYASLSYPQFTLSEVNHRGQNDSHRSSSFSDGDVCIQLDEYINWLARIYPAKAEALALCKERLVEHDIIYKTITNIRDSCFDAWGISEGMRILLKTNQGKYERVVAKGCA